jgi:DNA (cytosine-5)-methyltransferase 1
MQYFLDGFCGAGGASLGIERAGCRVAVAVNHDRRAITSHSANHAHTLHLNDDIRKVDLYKVARGLLVKGIRRINIWWSAECTHFSNAKGGASRDADSRMLSEELIRYVQQLGDHGISVDWVYIENVKEFLGWTVLLPKVVFEDKREKSIESWYAETQVEIFDAFASGDHARRAELKEQLDGLYDILQSSGAYLSDKKGKLTMVPDKESKGKLYEKWVQVIKDIGYVYDYKVLNAADFGIWQTRERYFGIFARKSLGLIPSFPEPTHSKKKGSHLKKWVACEGMLDKSDLGQDILTGRKGKEPLVQPTLDRIKYGIEKYGRFSGKDVIEVEAIDNYTFGSKPKGLDEPLDTVMAKRDKYFFRASFVVPSNFTNKPWSVNNVVPTILASRKHHYWCVPFIAQSYSSGGNACQVSSCDDPLWAVTCNNKANIVVPFIVPQFGQSKAVGLDEPLECVTVNPKYSCNVAFLTKYYSTGMNVSSIKEPCGTCTTKDRFCFVNCDLQPEMDDVIVLERAPEYHKTSKGDWICGHWGKTRVMNGYRFSRNILRIFYRMLKVSELKQAQGFPLDYKLDPKSETVAKKHIGNAVQVEMARLIVKANTRLSTVPALCY